MHFLFSTLLFLISPVLGVLFAFLHVLNAREVKTQEVFFLIVLFSTLLGILNACKIPESDLEVYKLWYEDVAHYSFLDYLFYLGKEPLFFLYNYLMYYLTFGFFELYLILNTAICYTIMGYALLKMHKAFKLPNEYFLIGLIFLFFFPNLFTLSAHINRQFLASSLLVLFIVDFVFYSKKRIALLLSTIFIHTSSAIYVLLFFLRKLNSNRWTIFLVSLIFIIVSYFLNQISRLFSIQSIDNSNAINYGLSRIQNREGAIEFETLGILSYALCLFVVLVFYWLKQRWRSNNRAILLYISLFILTFITVNYFDTELASRFSFFMYFLFPISLYFFLKLIELKKFWFDRKATVLFFLLIFGYWFTYKIIYGVWEYENIERVIFTGFWK
ncbi:EpsG family protein [Ulvibacterium sp.]|uniref:EpsG family protein n=1 Tax=Ulvibacterium sp. TaxID=2665914 RepID=UPI00345CA560